LAKLPVPNALKNLGVDPKSGLSATEAAKRLGQYGPNALEEKKKSEGLAAKKVIVSRLEAPRFVDYLFIAFNSSTAFSPTDAPVFARWAKVLTMFQSLISLTIVILLAARAVNIL